jgi:hypothetical protein
VCAFPLAVGSDFSLERSSRGVKFPKFKLSSHHRGELPLVPRVLVRTRSAA